MLLCLLYHAAFYLLAYWLLGCNIIYTECYMILLCLPLLLILPPLLPPFTIPPLCPDPCSARLFVVMFLGFSAQNSLWLHGHPRANCPWQLTHPLILSLPPVFPAAHQPLSISSSLVFNHSHLSTLVAGLYVELAHISWCRMAFAMCRVAHWARHYRCCRCLDLTSCRRKGRFLSAPDWLILMPIGWGAL